GLGPGRGVMGHVVLELVLAAGGPLARGGVLLDRDGGLGGGRRVVGVVRIGHGSSSVGRRPAGSAGRCVRGRSPVYPKGKRGAYPPSWGRTADRGERRAESERRRALGGGG